MKLLTSLAALGLSVLATAQSPLSVIPGTPSTVGYYGWNVPSPNHQSFFDLTVTTPVTLQAIATPLLTAAGQVGTLQVYLTNPGITTYVGNTGNAASWTLAASGAIVGGGTTGSIANVLTRLSCQQTGGAGLLLQPGSYGVAIRYLNVSPLLVATSATQTFSNAEMSVSGGAIQYNAWGALQAAIGGTSGFNAWCWRGIITYANGAFPHACAESSTEGTGCYTVNGSCFQEFTDSTPGGAAPSASAALTGRQLQYVYNGAGYLVVPGTATYLPPSPTATALPTNDDGESAITLTNPFVYAGGVATQLFVHTNGFVSVGSNNTLPNGLNYVPQIPGMLSATNAAWWSWHDFNTTEAGSGLIKWEEVGTTVYITWENVESYPTTAVNQSTLQFQFDTATGNVNVLWQTIDAVGGSGFLEGDDTIIGFSPGGNSPATGLIDIATLSAVSLTFPEQFPLSVDTSAKPLIGSTININTANQTLPGIGLNFVSVAEIPLPGLDLVIIGAPGCPAFVDPNQGVGNVISDLGLPGLSMSVAFPLPNNQLFAGFTIYSQSIWLDPTANAFGLLSSNKLKLLLGNF